MRWCTYPTRLECFYDAWFRFDFILVVLMVIETWIVPFIFLSGTGGSNLSSFSVLRLARLLRLSRITRLFRSLPEVMILLKGVATAFRSVMVTMLLLAVLLYVFGVGFRTQASAFPEIKDLYFSSVWISMWTLMLHGCLLDSVSIVLNNIKDESLFLALLFCTFIFCSNLTVMNMLIGILCDVVTRVKDIETERSERHKLRRVLSEIFDCYDFDGDEQLSSKEFHLMMENPEMIEILMQFGTDVNGLLTLNDMVFEENVKHDVEEKKLSFEDLLDLILRLKGAHNVRVTDVVEQREYTRQRIDHLEEKLREDQKQLKDGQASLLLYMQSMSHGTSQPSAPAVTVTVHWAGEQRLQRRLASTSIGEMLQQLYFQPLQSGLILKDCQGAELGPELTLGHVTETSPGNVDLYLEKLGHLSVWPTAALLPSPPNTPALATVR